MGIFDNVQAKNNRTKTLKPDSAVKTRWGSDHEECKRANINQKDLKLSLGRMITPTGVDKQLHKENQDNLSKVIPTDKEWRLYQQHESGISALQQHSKFTQSAKVVVHMELFEGRMAMERLGAKCFPVFENLSAIEGQHSRDLTKQKMNQLMTSDDFMPSCELEEQFDKMYSMMEEVGICRRVAFRELAVRLDFMERDPTFVGKYSVCCLLCC